jgi:hypothetical protein
VIYHEPEADATRFGLWLILELSLAVARSKQSDKLIPTPPTRILETPQPPGIMPEDEFKAMGDSISQSSTETLPSPKIMPKDEFDAMADFISKYATTNPDSVSEDPDPTR